MKVVCIIQARMGSTRLPGKVMLDLCGKTVLNHVIDRVKMVKNIDEIVIATTTKEDDDVIVKESKKCGVKVFRGSEDDVLSRYYYAAKENDADVVVRITSDCPLIDSVVTENTIDYYLRGIARFDYVSNTLKRTFPRGLDTEVFSFKSLERTFNESKLERDREHVTTYIWNNLNLFSLGSYENDVNYSNLRWTLDTIEDYGLIEKIYGYLYPEKENDFGIKDILKLYDKESKLYTINNKIEHKSI